jgi:DNA-nicking Smr family endonuclease
MTASRDARRRAAAAEAALWARATADVKPLARAPARRRRVVAAPAEAVAPPPPPPPAAVPSPRVAPPTAPAPRAAAGIDRRTLARLRRGDIALSGRLDLHGMTQAEAHAALDDFVDRGVRRGARLLLVITGKGSGGDGVLRRMLPRWIQAGPHAGRVLRLETAHARHGGEGAWYLYLRRSRGDAPA